MLVWYILGPERGSHIPTLGPRYVPQSYLDPLGEVSDSVNCRLLDATRQCLELRPLTEGVSSRRSFRHRGTKHATSIAPWDSAFETSNDDGLQSGLQSNSGPYSRHL